MATEYKLSLTASEINEKLNKIDNLAKKSEIPTKVSELENDAGYITKDDIPEGSGGVSSWNDLEDKPFGETVETVKITYDGDTTGLESVPCEGLGSYYKISDIVPRKEELIGGTFFIPDASDVINIDKITVENLIDITGGYCIGTELCVVINEYNSSDLYGCKFTSNGVWIPIADENPIQSCELKYTSETIHPIDPKYLPSGGVRPEEVTTIVKEQFPGGVGYEEMVEIVPETSVTTVADASMGGICVANLGAELAVEWGKTYAVMFNGVRYECVSDSVLGNMAIIGAPVDTGEPFTIVPNGVLVTRTEMDVTLSVVESVVHKLNTDFLQDDVPKYGKAGELMVFEWDGNTEGLDTFVDNGAPFYKVSDVVIPVEHIVSLKSERSDGHTSEDVYTNSYGCLVGQYSAAIVTNAENNNIPSNGVYFRYTAENGIRCLRVEIDTHRENTILYLNNPSGVKYAITVDDSGVLSATEVSPSHI